MDRDPQLAAVRELDEGLSDKQSIILQNIISSPQIKRIWCGSFDELVKYLLKEKNPNGCDLFQGIGNFIIRSTEAVKKFEFLVHHIHHNSEDISKKLHFIESTNLFKFPLPKNGDELPSKSLCFHLQAL